MEEKIKRTKHKQLEKYVYANQLALNNIKLIEINMHGEWRINGNGK